MNMIICNEKCRHQRDGYCCLTGSAQITNALASPCCYYEENSGNNVVKGDGLSDKNPKN